MQNWVEQLVANFVFPPLGGGLVVYKRLYQRYITKESVWAPPETKTMSYSVLRYGGEWTGSADLGDIFSVLFL